MLPEAESGAAHDAVPDGNPGAQSVSGYEQALSAGVGVHDSCGGARGG